MIYSAAGHESNINESKVQYILTKEKEICQSVRESSPESANLTTIVHDKAMEEIEK